ncbi:MAG: GNAT family N-acetyltransferase [Deltaproteobacteria bacterium]|nr:GNAT family N-acetyltransferase [Deltaproteobacteria bacterium]
MTAAATIDRVGPESNQILVNLFEHYLHDMAEWFRFDVGADGRYAYDVSPHWRNNDSVYLARVDGALAGFVIVGSAEPWTNDPASLDIREFFVIRRHRHSGVGRDMAHHVWNRHRGRWLVRVLEANLPAVPFWRKTIAAYSKGRYAEQVVTPDDGKRRLFFSFDNRNP